MIENIALSAKCRKSSFVLLGQLQSLSSLEGQGTSPTLRAFFMQRVRRAARAGIDRGSLLLL